MKSAVIIFGDLDPVTRQQFETHLRKNRMTLRLVPAKMQSMPVLAETRTPFVIICSMGKDQATTLDLVAAIRQRYRDLPLTVVTQNSSEERIIAAFRAGATDFLKAPVGCAELIRSHKRCSAGSLNFSDDTKTNSQTANHAPPIIGQSKAMRQVKTYLTKVASSDSTIFVTGETGTGKELVASTIHYLSRRQDKPLVVLNCAALPDNLVESELFGHTKGAFTGAITAQKGKLALANHGTLFLDEIGEMNMSAQAKILRCIDNREVYPLGAARPHLVDVRYIAATNRDPLTLVEEGKFRKDLFYRLKVAHVHLPPLRKRKEDIMALVAHGIGKLNIRFRRNFKGFRGQAQLWLESYDWPGNVRELMNLLEACYINTIDHDGDLLDLPEEFKHKMVKADKLPQDERRQIVAALLKTHWNKSAAAQKLSWSRMTLYRKMAKYNIIENRHLR